MSRRPGPERDAGVTVRRQVQATPEQVFAVLADGWSYAAWVVGASRMRKVDADWPAENAQLHHSAGVWPLVVDDQTKMITWSPPRSVTLEAEMGLAGTAIVDLEVIPTGAGVEIQITEDVARGPGKLVPKAVRHLLLAVRNTETLRRLALLVEGRSPVRAEPSDV